MAEIEHSFYIASINTVSMGTYWSRGVAGCKSARQAGAFSGVLFEAIGTSLGYPCFLVAAASRLCIRLVSSF
jgi:hypothetical protein